jgi:hypothetical protein
MIGTGKLPPIKTSEVSRDMNIGYERLFSWIRTRKIAAPAKDSSGDYCWSESDVEAARRVLAALNDRQKVPTVA